VKMSADDLRLGEYVVSFDADTQSFRIEVAS
jgi:hypothetical protein